MNTQLSLEPIHVPGLSERDFDPVKDLIEEVRRRESVLNAAVTWQNAYLIFRRLEKRLGLPESERERTVYLATLSDLRGAGSWLLECLTGRSAAFNVADVGLSVPALRACLTQLEVDERAVFLAEDTATQAKLAAHFA